MLYNTPGNDSTEEVCHFAEAKTGSTSRSSAGPRAFAARQPGGAIQEVWQTRLPLCRKQGAWPGLLPLRDSGNWKDSLLLRFRETKEANSSLPGKPPKAAGAHRREHAYQSINLSIGSCSSRESSTTDKDLHWADVSTVDLLAHLVDRFDRMRVMIVATYRPEEMRLAKHPFLEVGSDLKARGACREIQISLFRYGPGM